MTIFDLINDVLYKKTGKHAEAIDKTQGKDFSPFLLNRWLSMYPDVRIARWINHTTNMELFEDPVMNYKYFLSTLPKVAYKKISYIKKTKVDKAKVDKDAEVIDEIAHFRDLSKKEVKAILEFGKKLKQRDET